MSAVCLPPHCDRRYNRHCARVTVPHMTTRRTSVPLDAMSEREAAEVAREVLARYQRETEIWAEAMRAESDKSLNTLKEKIALKVERQRQRKILLKKGLLY